MSTTILLDPKKLGRQPVLMLVAEAAVIAAFALPAILLLKLGVHQRRKH